MNKRFNIRQVATKMLSMNIRSMLLDKLSEVHIDPTDRRGMFWESFFNLENVNVDRSGVPVEFIDKNMDTTNMNDLVMLIIDSNGGSFREGGYMATHTLEPWFHETCELLDYVVIELTHLDTISKWRAWCWLLPDGSKAIYMALKESNDVYLIFHSDLLR